MRESRIKFRRRLKVEERRSSCTVVCKQELERLMSALGRRKEGGGWSLSVARC